MKRLPAFLASVPLVMSSVPALAGELQFSVPSTDRAAQSAELLTRAAHALDDAVTRRPSLEGEGQLSNLWVFPTRDSNTVFARYTLVAKTPTSASATEHLALVELGANGTVEVQELSGAERHAPHWSASIGDGHTSNSNVPKATAKAGAPGPAHWTARIGTGRPLQSVETAQEEPAQVSIAANVHWTSKVGTARASQANGDSQ